MSQAGILSTTNGPVPANVPTSFTTDNGTAVPALNVLQITAIDVTDNSDNGIQVEGGLVQAGASNRVQVQLTNRATNQATTVDGSLTTLITFSLGVAAGVYYFEGNVVAANITDTLGGTYGFRAAVRTTGAAGVEIGSEETVNFEEVGMEDANIFATVSANNFLLQVQWSGGPAAKNISWNGILTYRFQAL